MFKFMISLLLSLYSENSIFFLIHHSMLMYINSNTLFNEYRFKRTEKKQTFTGLLLKLSYCKISVCTRAVIFKIHNMTVNSFIYLCLHRIYVYLLFDISMQRLKVRAKYVNNSN